MTTVVHVTHEAVHKVGGIGAVLTGMITAAAYRRAVRRTILVGPLLERPGSDALGPQGTLLHDRRNGLSSDTAGRALSGVETRRGLRILYGRRRLPCPDGTEVEPEVLLVDVESGPPKGLDRFKHQLYQACGLASDRYESDPEYERYVRLAEPAYEAVTAVLGERCAEPVHVLAHEFMGLPTALKARLADDPGVYTLFYAHEVATARRLVEQGRGGDVRFYGALRAADGSGRFVEDVFGPQDDYFKHALVSRAWRCHAVLAVGDLVVEELRFLGGRFAGIEIDRVYNGLPPAPALAPADRRQAREALAAIVEGLLGWRPRGVFTHVGRLVPSKGFWRDLQVLEQLERVAPRAAGPWVLIVLATETGPRPPERVAAMRAGHGWPLAHREGYPDLTPGELRFDLRVRAHNARSRRTKVVFFNQFGFDAGSTGGAVPPGMDLDGLRRGSDAEFGLSTYEPFGIAQIEALAFGGLSVVSDACGCVGFLREAAAPGGPPVHVCGDYTRRYRCGGEGEDPASLLSLDDDALEAGERARSAEVAAALARALPSSGRERERLLEAGREAASGMSWEGVVERRFLPVLRRLERAGGSR